MTASLTGRSPAGSRLWYTLASICINDIVIEGEREAEATTRLGGITELHKLAAMAEAQAVKVAPHYGSVPWLLISCLFVVLTVLLYNFLGDGLRAAADPYS